MPVATAGGHDGILQELPQAKTPVTLVAAPDPVTGKSEFRYQGNNTPPVIRVQPGSVLNVEYKNELAAQSREDCFGHRCMQMTNLHFHGLHVSPNPPQLVATKDRTINPDLERWYAERAKSHKVEVSPNLLR